MAGASTAHTADVIQWACDNNAFHQQWEVNDIDHGQFAIVARHSGLCLDVAWAGTDDRANVIQANCRYTDNQRWYKQPTSDGYMLLKAKHSLKCLDVAWAGQANGADILQSGCWHGNNQQWLLKEMHN